MPKNSNHFNLADGTIVKIFIFLFDKDREERFETLDS